MHLQSKKIPENTIIEKNNKKKKCGMVLLEENLKKRFLIRFKKAVKELNYIRREELAKLFKKECKKSSNFKCKFCGFINGNLKK